MLARHRVAGFCSSMHWLWNMGGSQKDMGTNQEKLWRGMLGWKKAGLAGPWLRLPPHPHMYMCVYVHTCVVNQVLEEAVSLEGQAVTRDRSCQSGEGGSVP